MEHSIRRGPRGHLADLLEWDPTSAQTPTTLKVVVLFVPGNPGLPQYYIPFLSAIQAALPPGSAAVHALGHLGHSPSTPRIWTARSVVSLREQVQHKLQFVDELKGVYKFGEEGAPKLVLIGHSIGSWVICELLKLRYDMIDSVHFLFPTLSHMLTSTNGRRLAPLFSSTLAPAVALATSGLSLAPSMLVRVAIGARGGQSAEASAVTASVVQSPGTVVAMLAMAGEEMASVTDLDKKVLADYGARMRWYWAKGEYDGWVSDRSVQEIVNVLEGAGHGAERRVRCEEGMKHAFVEADHHVQSLARKCAAWITEDANMHDA